MHADSNINTLYIAYISITSKYASRKSYVTYTNLAVRNWVGIDYSLGKPKNFNYNCDIHPMLKSSLFIAIQPIVLTVCKADYHTSCKLHFMQTIFR